MVAVALRFHCVTGLPALVAAIFAEVFHLTLTAGMCALVRVRHANLQQKPMHPAVRNRDLDRTESAELPLANRQPEA
jgi:hypothetical protein